MTHRNQGNQQEVAACDYAREFADQRIDEWPRLAPVVSLWHEEDSPDDSDRQPANARDRRRQDGPGTGGHAVGEATQADRGADSSPEPSVPDVPGPAGGAVRGGHRPSVEDTAPAPESPDAEGDGDGETASGAGEGAAGAAGPQRRRRRLRIEPQGDGSWMSFQRHMLIAIGWRLADECPHCIYGLFLVILAAADPATGVLEVRRGYELWPRSSDTVNRMLKKLEDAGDIEVDRQRGRPPHITVFDYVGRWVFETRWLAEQQAKNDPPVSDVIKRLRAT